MTGAPASGVVEGGWEFVTAAYALSALIMAGYFISVHLRYRAERRREEREARRPSEAS